MKKLTAVLLVLCMVLSMGACSESSGKKKSKKDSKDDKKSTKSEAKVDDEEENDDDDNDDDDKGVLEDIVNQDPVLLRDEYFDVNGNLLFTIDYEYVTDRWGKLRMTDSVITGDVSSSLHTHFVSQHTDFDEDFLHSTYYTNDVIQNEKFYDEDGKVIKELTYDNSQLSKTTLYEYDGAGNEIKRSIYAPSVEEAEYYEEIISTYENDLLVFEDVIKYNSGEVTGGQTFDYEYDNNGNLIKMTNYYKYNDFTSITTYEYDEHNHCTLECLEASNSDGSAVSFSYRYYQYTYNADGTYDKQCFCTCSSLEDVEKLKNGQYGNMLCPTQILTYEGKRVLGYQYFNSPTDASVTNFYVDEYSHATFGIPNT